MPFSCGSKRDKRREEEQVRNAYLHVRTCCTSYEQVKAKWELKYCQFQQKSLIYAEFHPLNAAPAHILEGTFVIEYSFKEAQCDHM